MSTPGGFIDKNFYVADDVVARGETQLIDAPPQYNDAYKIPGRTVDSYFANKTIISRNEDCVDGVRVHRNAFKDFTLSPHGQNGVTLKGSSSDNEFYGLSFTRHGKRSDIELGQFDNYWFPGRAPTRRNHFEGVGQTDGTPVRVLLWDADESNTFIFQSGTKATRVPKLIWFPYFLFRYAQIRVVNAWFHLVKKQPAPIATS